MSRGSDRGGRRALAAVAALGGGAVMIAPSRDAHPGATRPPLRRPTAKGWGNAFQ